MKNRLEIIEACQMRHRGLLGSQGKPTVAKSVSIGNRKLLAKPKLELLRLLSSSCQPNVLQERFSIDAKDNWQHKTLARCDC